jgi:carbamate kinase
MRIVVALGGNALLRRGEPLTVENQRENVRAAAVAIAPVIEGNEIVITHGNGPQVGLLALQATSYDPASPVPLDVLGAESEGMIGYMIEQELGNLLPFEQPFATILTMVEVDREDPAFHKPTKPIGPVYRKAEAERIAAERGWSIVEDGDGWRRVVASPIPRHIFELRPIRWLMEKGVIVICAGGGGIPTVYSKGKLQGAEVVIDKDRASALLASELDADMLVMLTDVDGVYQNWGGPDKALIKQISPHELLTQSFVAGSMGPKVEAACAFVDRPGRVAAIGCLEDLPAIVAGEAGTQVMAGEPETGS